jgi:hypothetical protein
MDTSYLSARQLRGSGGTPLRVCPEPYACGTPRANGHGLRPLAQAPPEEARTRYAHEGACALRLHQSPGRGERACSALIHRNALPRLSACICGSKYSKYHSIVIIKAFRARPLESL